MQSLQDIPSWLATAWGIDLISTQIIMSAVVLFMLVTPVMLVRKNRSGFNVELLVGFFAEVLCVGLGWLHYWVLIVTIVIVAIAVAILGSEKIFGK